MFVEIAVGVIVAGVVGLGDWLTRSGRLLDFALLIQSTFEGDTARAPRLGKAHRRLLRLLLRDQSRWGRHFGQFGRSASLAESPKWNSTKERQSTKPRMFMTRWPCYVLDRHQIAPRALRRAMRGIRHLFVKGYITGQEDWTKNTWAERPGPS